MANINFTTLSSAQLSVVAQGTYKVTRLAPAKAKKAQLAYTSGVVRTRSKASTKVG
jgi:hypothetical protein